MFGKKEFIAILISILILSFVFGFNDGSKTFSLNFWLLNFLKVLIIVTISVLLRELVMKIIARKKGCDSEYELWGIKRYWFYEHNRFNVAIPFAAIISVLVTLFSNGKAFFTVLGKNVIKANRKLRVGREYTRLTHSDENFIIAAGILVTGFLAILFNLFDQMSWVDFSLIVNINMWLTLWSLLPLPSLNAGRLFFNSRSMYIFILALVLFIFILKDLNIVLDLILSILVGGFLVAIYYYYVEY